MERFINFELISNPINWVIIALMLAIATFGLNIAIDKDDQSILSTGSAGL